MTAGRAWPSDSASRSTWARRDGDRYSLKFAKLRIRCIGAKASGDVVVGVDAVEAVEAGEINAAGVYASCCDDDSLGWCRGVKPSEDVDTAETGDAVASEMVDRAR